MCSAEVFPTGIRSVALVFTTCTQYVAQFTIVYSTPYMMVDITYGTFIFFATSVVVGATFVFFCVPETKGIAVEEMDTLFSREGLPRTWRRQADEILAERRRDGSAQAQALGKQDFEHQEAA